MNEMLNDKLANFSHALIRLNEGLKETGYALSLDGTLQRFEFTFEMAWKALKKFLLIDGYDCASPRDCVKKAFKAGYIKNEQLWLDIISDRNLSSHVYNENDARRIYEKIRTAYAAEFDKLETFLKEKIKTF